MICRVARSQELPLSVVIFSATAAADPTAAVGGRRSVVLGRESRDGVVDRSRSENLRQDRIREKQLCTQGKYR